MFESIKQNFSDRWGNILTKRTIAGLLVFLILLFAVPIGTYLVEQRTNLNPKAEVNPTMSIQGLQSNPDGGPGITTTSSLSLVLNPGGGTSQNAIVQNSTRCELTATCQDKTCTFDLSKFYIDGVQQPKGSYRATLTPDINNTSVVSGWVCSGYPNEKTNCPEGSTDQNCCTPSVGSGYAIQHTYGSGVYTAKMEVKTDKSPGYASCIKIVRTGTSAPKCDNPQPDSPHPDERRPDSTGCWCSTLTPEGGVPEEKCFNTYAELFARENAAGRCNGKLAGNVGVKNVSQEIPGKVVNVTKGQVWGGGQGIHPAGSPKDPDYKYIGATIEVFDNTGAKVGEGTTGNNGKYSVQHLQPGPHSAKLGYPLGSGYKLVSGSRRENPKTFDIDSCDDQDNAGWDIEPQ